MKKFDFVIQRQNFYYLESGEFEMEVDLIHYMIVEEAKRRMLKTTYQNLAAAIHEVLMEVGMACGDVMKAQPEDWEKYKKQWLAASPPEEELNMEDVLEVTTGKGDHIPSNKRNCKPIQLDLCCDGRREECLYYVKVNIQTDKVSFYQGFCAWESRKGD
jgi:hypothetical protein